MRKFLSVVFGLGLLLGWGLPVRALAQTQAEVDLYPTDVSAFPVISTFMDVFDASGRFVSGLKPGDVTVLEDSQPLQLLKLNEMVVPAQIAVAINPGPALSVHDKQGLPAFSGDRQRAGRLGAGSSIEYAGRSEPCNDRWPNHFTRGRQRLAG